MIGLLGISAIKTMILGRNTSPMAQRRTSGMRTSDWFVTILENQAVLSAERTGKSYAMKRRVARLLESGVEPERILAVTFTRNAAADLINDLLSLEVQGCDEIRAGTLHSFCFRLLRDEDVFGVLGRTPRPLLTFEFSKIRRFEAEPMLADVLGQGNFGTSRDATRRLLAFEAAWARLQSEEPGWPEDETDVAFHERLLAWLTFHGSMLIGELITLALRYLRTNPASPYRTAFDHVVVDEYQDLNRAEQELVNLLVANNVAIVGDEDQSIYSFRHANPEGISDYSNHHQETSDYALLECRRCPQQVVAVADHLIRQNHPGENDTRLHPHDGNPEGEIHVVQWDSVEEEGNGLGSFVEHLVKERHIPPGQILVLSQRRLFGYAVRDKLRAEAIPVHSFYHDEALKPPEAQEAMCLLTLLCDRTDRPALRWWLGYGSQTWRRNAYARVREHCENTGLSPMDCLAQLADNTFTLPYTKPLIERHEILIDRLSQLEEMNSEQLVGALLPEEEDWAEGLRNAAAALDLGEVTRTQLLEKIRTNISQPEMPDGGDFVRVMSLHKSKGLTARAVVVTGCIEGLVPKIDETLTPAEQNRSLAEQRRLFYVAVTRCREILVLSSVRRLDAAVANRLTVQTGYGGKTTTSRFVADLGPQCPQAVRGAVWLDG